MAKKEMEFQNNIENGFDNEEIASILGKIDALVSLSGGDDATPSSVSSFSQLKTEELKDEGFSDAQLAEITRGVDQNLDTSVYEKKCYNWMQMREIRRGLLENLDVSLYSDPLYSSNQMQEIRLGLSDRLEVSSFAKLVFSATDMRRIRQVLFNEKYKSDSKQFGKVIEDAESGILLRISDDCLNAYIKVPKNVTKEPTASYISRLLEDHNIVYGLLKNNIKKLVHERITDVEICVAEGRAPIDGKPGRYEMFFENSIEKGRTVAPDYEIDYSEVNIIDMVNPGQLLAQYHPAQKGIPGMSITNNPINESIDDDLPVLAGVGFTRNEEQNTYTANIKGYASYDKATNSLNVWNVYEIRGDVSYFQSVEFDGTIHVSGSVHNSAVLRAKGDIIIDGFVESAFIHSLQNIVIKSGVNGNSVGIIEAGGSIRGKFFENVAIKAKGMIEGNYFLNSNIYTDDYLIARGKKARIMGGNITAALGVEANTIGNYLSTKTIYNVGDIYGLDKQIIELEHGRKEISDELHQLMAGQQKLFALIGAEQAAGNPLLAKTTTAIQIKELQLAECNKEISRLKLVMKRADKAYVKVRSELQADVMLTINGQRKKIGQTINRMIVLTKGKN